MQTNTKSQRDYRFEFIRVLAIFFVIGVHTYPMLQPDGSAIRDFNIYFFSTLFFCCNGIFFMMSGKFALNKTVDDNQLGKFYFKKLVYLILPVFIYMFVYSIYELLHITNSLEGLSSYFTQAIVNKYCYGYHFWFMFALVGCILVSPFLAKIMDGISKKAALILVGMGIAFNTLFSYTPYWTELPLAWSFPFASWTVYFLIGGCFDKIIDNKFMERLLLVLGLVGFAIIMLKNYFFSYKVSMYSDMPSYTFYSMMMYMLMQKFQTSNKTVQKVILFLGRRTFGIYLIHFMLILMLGPSFLPLKDVLPSLAFLLLLMVSIYVISLVTSYIFDIFCINVIQDLCERLRIKLKSDVSTNS